MGNHIPFNNLMVGFDRLFEDLNNINHGASNYPPYNILKYDDTKYVVEMALAGWSQDQIDIQEHNCTLTIIGDKVGRNAENVEPSFIHKGIGHRAFTREFKLADHMHVNNAELVDGILTVNLNVDVPQELRPRTIRIGLQA
jgi:molecular chaperone IbpA